MTADEARPGTIVGGRYELAEVLGQGGMGTVWLATDSVLRRDVAVKEVLLPGLLNPRERDIAIERSLREARAAAGINHPNVITVYDVVRQDERPWIVMEYLPGRSLEQILAAEGPLPPARVAVIGSTLLKALQAAHRAGIQHRDVKPSNVLIADDGRVVLTDFGSAMIDEGDGAITRTGVILGSPQYIAPERVDTGVSTPEADLWSLGATLYTAVEGRPPYTRSTTLRSLIALTTERPDPARLAGPLKPVLTGLLQHNPRARMKPAEVERRLRRLADVQTTVHLRKVPDQREPDSTAGPRRELAAAARPAPDLRPVPVPSGPAAVARVEPARPGAARDAGGAAPVERAVSAARRHWRAVAAAVLGAVVVPLAVLAVSTGHPGIFTGSARHAAQTSAAPPTAAAPASASPSAAAAATPPPPSPRFVLPGRFLLWKDKTGYQVAWPAKWSHQREAPTVMFFCAPGGPPTLRVKVWDGLGPDLVAAFVRQEQTDALPGYRRIRIEATPDAADHDTVWEYEFTDPKAGRLHGLEHAFVAAGHTYVIQWRAPTAKWTGSLADLQVVRNSFRPARA
jgi:predicted Ser/Thr protein kinase